jgi:predicted ester cyclase
MKSLIVGSALAFSQLALAGHKVDLLKSFYQNLNKDNMELVDEFYDSNVKFADPIVSLSGSAAVKAYYTKLYQNVKTINFDFKDMIESGDTVVAIWIMTLQTDKLNNGEPFKVEGNSIVKFKDTGKAVYHRDYFDMGEFIYERLPVLGFVIKKIKVRMEE